MWILVLFDLPVLTPVERKEATGFRNLLLDNGFEMSQFSVYQRFCSSKEAAENYIKIIERSLPSGGKVHILMFTDKQYGAMRSFVGRKKEKKNNPEQYEMF